MKDSEFVGGRLKLREVKIKKSKKSKKNNREEKYRSEEKENVVRYNEERYDDKKQRNVHTTNEHDYANDYAYDDTNEDIYDGFNKRVKKGETKENTESANVEEKLNEILQLNLTESEKAYQLVLKKREKQRIENILKVSYRERLQKFNDNLASLSEHFDIPKVGPG
ncbi:conserved Plasmodium protein, unknown function [Plasmodium malariae]|uniref:Uncharacterized protein n=1 Tax=Plasmodium malariae TaxID=5858 RepID=A0A1C3L393_PLAMA|nr:conserved Plasmodium protein, unknown function [Plasmodium malariae]